MPTPDEAAADLAHKSLSTGDITGWFEPLYAAAAQGDAVIPWDRGGPHPLLVDWASGPAAGAGRAVKTEGMADASTAAAGRHEQRAVNAEAMADGSTARAPGRALVVGCGPGHDAEFVATLGYDTTAFDVSRTAIDGARERHPHTTVDYRVADLFELPTEWHRHFDLVVEAMTVQAMPRAVRDDATAAVRELVAPGGTLLVIGIQHPECGPLDEGPPWPLTAVELEAFATDGLQGQLITAPSQKPRSAPHYRYELTRTVPTGGETR